MQAEYNVARSYQWDFLKYFALAPVLGYVVVIALLSTADVEWIREAPSVLLGLNTLFLSLIPLIAAFLAARSYLRTGSHGILLMGCGLLMFGCTSVITGWVVGGPGGINDAVTIFNTGSLLASVCHGTSAFLSLTGSLGFPARFEQRRKLVLAIAYVGVLILIAFITMASIMGLIPTFFIQGQGPTLLRQLVLSLAVTFFGLSSFVFMQIHFMTKSAFLYWYSLSLLLIMEGLGTMLFLRNLGSPINWVGRTFQYIGGIYFLIAVITAFKEARTRGITIERTLPTLVDIAELREAEEALRESEERYRSVFENSLDGIMLTVPDGHILEANPEACRMFGYTEEELCRLGRNGIVDLAYPGLSEMLEERSRTGKFKGELAFIRKDGTKFPAEISSAIFKDEQGQNRNILVVRDITQRKQTEEALCESEEKYRNLFNTMDEGFVIGEMLYDEDGKAFDYQFIEVNPAYERITGVSHEESLRKTVKQRYPNMNASWIEQHAEVVETGEPKRWENYGEYTNQYYEICTYRPSSGRFASVFSDITNRKRAEEELRRAHDELELRVRERTAELELTNRALREYTAKLERLNKELEDFSFIAAHDLQEPLRKIQMFGDRIKTKYKDSLDEEVRDLLERVIRSANRMSALLRSLQSYSLVAPQTEAFVPVELSKVVREAVSDLEPVIKKTGGHVDIGDLPMAEVDETQMQQLFRHLIGNALKYSKENEKPLIKVYGRTLGDTCRIYVEDNGIGFEDIYKDRIFRPFQRLHRQGVYEGTGMGLAVCRKIAEHHAGNITARSTPGSGSTFILTLPLRQQRL